VLAHLAAGTLTSDHIEALTATAPKTKKKIQDSVMISMKSTIKPIPLKNRPSAQLLFGKPPASVDLGKIMQTPAPGPSKQGGGGRHKPLKLSDNTSLNSDKVKS
jgi:hypothetical protein